MFMSYDIHSYFAAAGSATTEKRSARQLKSNTSVLQHFHLIGRLTDFVARQCPYYSLTVLPRCYALFSQHALPADCRTIIHTMCTLSVIAHPAKLLPAPLAALHAH